MNSKSGKIALILAAAALCVSVASLIIVLGRKPSEPAPLPPPQEEAPAVEQTGDIQYVLYLGTNDQNTNEPVYTPEESKSILEDILIEYMGGYTIQEAYGGWLGDDGTEYQEYTLVIYLSDTDIDTVHSLCDELLSTYNQSAILIQSNVTTTEFYAG